MKISLVTIALNSYKKFIPGLIESADKFFFNGDVEVEYCLLVDEQIEDLESNRDIKQGIIPKHQWPESTLFRYRYINNFAREQSWFSDSDYIVYMDSDMEFMDIVGEEILSQLTVVDHPWFKNKRGTPETDPRSTACIRDDLDFFYKQNCFFCGEKDFFLSMSEFLEKLTDIDYKKGIVAKWHDESHANKFYIAYATKVLNTEYNTPNKKNRRRKCKIAHFSKHPFKKDRY